MQFDAIPARHARPLVGWLVGGRVHYGEVAHNHTWRCRSTAVKPDLPQLRNSILSEADLIDPRAVLQAFRWHQCILCLMTALLR